MAIVPWLAFRANNDTRIELNIVLCSDVLAEVLYVQSGNNIYPGLAKIYSHHVIINSGLPGYLLFITGIHTPTESYRLLYPQ